jgi:hypothetical protein
MASPGSIADVIARFERIVPHEGDEKRHFHAVYYRNTLAVQREVDRGAFLDPIWVDAWDVAFADLYLDALETWDRGERPSAPWRLAFEGARDPDIRPLVHVLVAMNAHINYDLPQSVLAVMTDDELADDGLIHRRQVDFERIDETLVRRVREEDLELRTVSEPGDYTFLDRLLTPFNRLASKRFLKESRTKVWRNTLELARARRSGPDAYAERLGRLEELCRAKVEDLLRPGQVLVRLGVSGFGVLLPPV